jgi:hypothetical protein
MSLHGHFTLLSHFALHKLVIVIDFLGYDIWIGTILVHVLPLHSTLIPPWCMRRAPCMGPEDPRATDTTPARPVYTSGHICFIMSQHIHSGTELQGTFQRWNRGVDVHYYSTLRAECGGV